MPRLPAWLGSLFLLLHASAAPAARYARPGVDADVAGEYRADRVTVRLLPSAAALARAAVARAPRSLALPRLAALGVPALDHAAAAAGVLAFEPEFPAEPAPGGARTDFGAFFYAELVPGTDVDAALAVLRASRDVASATPIALVRVTLSPNDSLYAQQWSMKPAPGIDAEHAWTITAGDSAIPIAIVDTGVLSWHPDLAGTTGGPGQLWTNAAEANGLPGVDDDGNGYVDDVHGWDFVDLLGSSGVINNEDWRDEDPDPNDFAGHGTLVAGFAAALTNNTIGVAGTAWGARLVPLRIGWSAVGAQGGVVDMSFAARAIRYATRTGIRVVNCSFQTVADPALFAAVDEATRAGVLVVNAAGNAGEPCDFPGSDCHELADREDVLGVGALAPTGAISSVSETGDYIDVYAPGEGLPSTITYGDSRFGVDSLTSRTAAYATNASGTSLAAPIASGVAAMVLADRAHHALVPLRPMELLFRLAESDTEATGPRRLDATLALRHTTVSFAVRGARIVGAPVVLATTSGARIIVAATSDSALVWYSERGDTLHRVALGAAVVGSPAAAAPEPGFEPRVFVSLDDGRVSGFDGHGDGLPGWFQGINDVDGVPAEGPSLADVDGDGFADVVVLTDAGTVYAWNPFGQRLSAFPQVTDGAPVGTAALADLDGRRGADVIVTTQGGRVFAFRDSATAPNVPGWPRALTAGSRAPVVARFGATPVPRVIVAYGSSLRAYTPAGTALWTRALGGDAAADPALGDVDGDGIDDIVVPLANPDAIAAFDTAGTPLPGWPVALAAPASGPPLVRAAAGRVVVYAPVGGKLFAFAGDGTRIDGWPKAGPAGNAASWFTGGAGERLLAGGADSLLYFYTPPRGLAAADPVRSWASLRGTFARAASRFDVAYPGAYDDIPSVVTSVVVEATGPNSVTLGWSATGDDGYRGRPKEYVVTYTGGPGDPSPIVHVVVPATVDAGQHERATIGGLAPVTLYRFTIVARDAAGNESVPSNAVFVMTTAPVPAVSIRALAQPSRLPVTIEWRALGVLGQRLEVYDVTGRLRQLLEIGSATSGSLVWDGVDRNGRVLESGLYFVRLRGGAIHDPTARLVVVK